MIEAETCCHLVTLNKINMHNTSCVLTCESLLLTCIHIRKPLRYFRSVLSMNVNSGTLTRKGSHINLSRKIYFFLTDATFTACVSAIFTFLFLIGSRVIFTSTIKLRFLRDKNIKAYLGLKINHCRRRISLLESLAKEKNRNIHVALS